ncbi:capsid cement protein [Micromonospora okii]|uniref:capsid cement protein n=1 Tax=Micromonospora okii TaxID=1182970 RepID=UPI001E52BB4E|nr:capsid cement protein [Micromonospora okii]
MANECIPFYEPGKRLTGHATAAVTGCRFVAISGNRQADGSISVAHAAAGTKAFGVAAYDAASGEKVGIIRGDGFVVPVMAGANLAANQRVEVGTNGQAIILASGVAVGTVVTGATSGNLAQIALD